MFPSFSSAAWFHELDDLQAPDGAAVGVDAAVGGDAHDCASGGTVIGCTRLVHDAPAAGHHELALLGEAERAGARVAFARVGLHREEALALMAASSGRPVWVMGPAA